MPRIFARLGGLSEVGRGRLRPIGQYEQTTTESLARRHEQFCAIARLNQDAVPKGWLYRICNRLQIVATTAVDWWTVAGVSLAIADSFHARDLQIVRRHKSP
jgi:hypothetical protein